MTKDQRIVALGASSGVASMLAAMFAIYHLWPVPAGLVDAGDRIAFALKGLAFAVLPLVFMIVAVGNERFLSEAIDPTLGKDSSRMEINGRVTENTMQQFVLFAVALLALAASVPAEQMRIVPAAVIVFVVARTAFWIGYRIHPLYRAFGFASTLYLNAGLLVYALWRCLASG